jgi:hypothetical protein
MRQFRVFTHNVLTLLYVRRGWIDYVNRPMSSLYWTLLSCSTHAYMQGTEENKKVFQPHYRTSNIQTTYNMWIHIKHKHHPTIIPHVHVLYTIYTHILYAIYNFLTFNTFLENLFTLWSNELILISISHCIYDYIWGWSTMTETYSI